MKKEKYIKPIIDLIIVELESCIASGSAKVLPTNSNNMVQEMWEEEADEQRTISW